jgi:hypothetical protein
MQIVLLMTTNPIRPIVARHEPRRHAAIEHNQQKWRRIPLFRTDPRLSILTRL